MTRNNEGKDLEMASIEPAPLKRGFMYRKVQLVTRISREMPEMRVGLTTGAMAPWLGAGGSGTQLQVV